MAYNGKIQQQFQDWFNQIVCLNKDIETECLKYKRVWETQALSSFGALLKTQAILVQTFELLVRTKKYLDMKANAYCAGIQ